MHCNGNDFFRHLDILTTGTTKVSDQSQDNTNFILAGASLNNAPTLEFIGSGSSHDNYSVSSLLVENGNLFLDYNSYLTVTNGIAVLGGTLFVDDLYSSMTLDGNSLIDANGTFSNPGFNGHGGGPITLNGKITVGSLGTNNLTLPTVLGNGTILQTGSNDVTNITAADGGVHLNIRSGALDLTSSFGRFAGTIGPANEKGPSLGPSAIVNYFGVYSYPDGIKSATYDTSTGLLSFMNAKDQPSLDTLHFSGDASGLNVSASGGGVIITDHPGSTSPVPITFI